MARGRGRASNRFDRPKICGEMRIAQTRKEFLHGRETALQNKAEDATVSAHLTASDRVILMRFQAGIKRGRDLRMSFHETRNLQRALVLLAYAQMQGFHSPQ